MARLHGKDSYLYINGMDVTSFLDSGALSWSRDVAETTSMGEQSKTYIPGPADASLSVSGRYDMSPTIASLPAAMATAMAAASGASFAFGPAGNGLGKDKYTGLAITTSFNTSAPVGDVVAFTAEFQVSGGVAKSSF